MNNFTKIKFNQFILLLFIKFSNCEVSNNLTISAYDLYSLDYRKIMSSKVFKNYLTFDNTNSEVLYMEFQFSESNSTMESYHLYNIYWFTNNTDLELYNYFFGIANTKALIKSNFTLFSDIILCRVVSFLQKRCDDYFMSHSGAEIEYDFLENFDIQLDYLNGGRDNILSYETNWLITDNVNPYNSLVKFSIVLPSYSDKENEIFDLDLNFKNNLTIFYGKIVNETSEKLYINPKLLVNKVVSRNYSELLLRETFITIKIYLLIIILISYI